MIDYCKYIIALSLLSLFIPLNAYSMGKTSKVAAVPRFSSIKVDEANMRTGPNARYPITWVFVRKGEPVEVIAEFEHWRKIRDKTGAEGWVHGSVLSPKRTVIISASQNQYIYDKPNNTSSAVCIVEPEVRASLRKCQNKEWCQLQVENCKGWIERKYLWGIYPEEEI